MATSKKKKWWVYMLRSIKHGWKSDGVIYIGVTTNIQRRIKQHNDGKGAKFTRGRGPWDHMACCSYDSRSDALKVEARLKKLSHKEKLAAATYDTRSRDAWSW